MVCTTFARQVHQKILKAVVLQQTASAFASNQTLFIDCKSVFPASEHTFFYLRR